jgi:hypothetical protein
MGKSNAFDTTNPCLNLSYLKYAISMEVYYRKVQVGLIIWF